MSLPPGRIALDGLDGLDARLEALWRGTDLPAPEDPAGPVPDGAAELVRWVTDRLDGIPREPEGPFTRQVGSLLEEFRSRRSPWNAAALRLLGDPYNFVATGPRLHEDWAYDVIAVLHRSVLDPRGWVRLDPDRDNTSRDQVPAYPFDPPAASRFPERLYPIGTAAAVAALAVMTEEWQSEPAPVRSRPDQDAVLADARTLLGRYGSTAGYWTNATAGASGPEPDFLAAGLAGTGSHSFLTGEYINGLDLFEDLGLIAVNDEEVGVFWSVGAY
ncbi:hypothetical protein ACIBCU_28490 [Streptomyces sp. NPDC051064]|uniref:hypothetical protein n=1 Tax=Streptomyces sp. NPDC051064 TaxID=3365641 RepID=UPI0037A6858C